MTFTCQGCGKLYNVSDSFAGKHVRCKLCGTAMTVPFLSAPAAFTAPVPARPLEYVQTEADAYVNFAGEELIDRFLPWGMLVLFLAFLVELIHKTYVALSTNLRPTPSSAYVSGFLTGTTLVWLVMVFGVVAPLLMLGVFIGSKIMDFRNKPLLYWRCAAVAMTPPVMILVVNGFNLNHIRDGWIWWIIMLVPMTGVLWLMLRLRVGQFSVAATFALLCGVAAPLGLLFAIAVLFFWGAASRATRTTAAIPPARPPSYVSPFSPRVRSSIPSAPTGPVNRASLEAQLLRINVAIGKYASANGGLYPPRISTLAENGLLSIPDRSPQGGGPWVYGGLGQRFPAGAHVVILHDNNTSDGKRTCLFGDGHVQTINMADWRNVFHESNLSKRTGQ